MITLVPELQVFKETNHFRITFGDVGIDPDDNVVDQLCDLLDCDRILAFPVNILGKGYTLFCSKEKMLKKDGWLPTFPIRNEKGEVIDLIANNYIILKNWDETTFTPMEHGEMEAIIAQMDSIKDEAIAEAGKMKLNHK